MMTNDELISWFGEQSSWLQDAARVYYVSGTFAENDIKRFVKECIDEVSGIKKNTDLSGLNFLYRNDRKGFAIKSISDVEGVNALASNKVLNFATSGITVVYGDNGAGKSGYIRIIKKAADAKYKEELKGNVYSAAKKKQTCKISVLLDDNSEQSLDCDLSKNGEHAILRDTDIFDTRISTAYLDDENEAAYEPWVFLLFRELANVATIVKNQLENTKNSLNAHEILIPAEIANTLSGKRLTEITANTSFEGSFFEWNPTDDRALEEKEKEANIEAITKTIERLTNEINQLRGVQKYLDGFVDFFSEKNVTDISSAEQTLKDIKNEQEVAKRLFSEEASGLDKDSVSNVAWRALWKDAKDYYETILKKKGIKKYTEEYGYCPLCGQTIAREHMHRVQSVEEYVNGNISTKVTKAKKDYIDCLRKCPRAWANDQLMLSLDACGLESCRKNVEECAKDIYEISSKIHSDQVETVSVCHIDVGAISMEVERVIRDKSMLRSEKEALLQDEDRQRLEKEIKELKAKRFASQVKEEVAQRIAFLRSSKTYEDAIRLTATNKITSKSKILSEELLTEDYVRRFNDELKVLTRGTIKAKLKQQKVSKGKVPFRIALEGTADEKVRPTDVFSEGEKRVVSLAAFFAESSGRSSVCPLIVDDPISSLDIKYESYVMDRLVEAGRHRQVIVFTHRLSMVVGLYSRCGKDVQFNEVELRGRGKEKGVPSEVDHFSKQTSGKLKDLKNNNVAKVKKMDENSSEYTESVHYICQQIRNLVEKSIEDTLLFSVVSRYRQSIQTQQISWLSHITEDDCVLIEEMMTKYSHYDHSMSDETPLQEFSIEEIENDLDKLITWIDEIKKRQNSYKK